MKMSLFVVLAEKFPDGIVSEGTLWRLGPPMACPPRAFDNLCASSAVDALHARPVSHPIRYRRVQRRVGVTVL